MKLTPVILPKFLNSMISLMFPEKREVENKTKHFTLTFYYKKKKISHFCFSLSSILSTSALFAPEHFGCNHTRDRLDGVLSTDAEYPDDHTCTAPCHTDMMVLWM